jgi:hypothetical protein
MKVNPKYLLVIAVMTLTVSTFAQTLRRVNNNPGITLSPNMYSSLQAAHDAANPGDTLYIEISTILYDAVALTKQLTIIGPGSWSDVYDDERGQGTEGATRVEAITFSAGSAGSSIIGVLVDGMTENSITINGVSDLTIDRVRMNWIKFIGGFGNANNILISRCYLQNGFIAASAPAGVWSYSGVVITNSILISALYYQSIQLETDNRFFGTIENCLIKGFIIAKNFAINNNILLSDNAGTLGASTLSNNVSFSTLGSVNGVAYNDNQFNVDMSTVFEVAPSVTSLPAGVTEESRWQLKEGSPAIGAGIGGIDCGPYGGVTPYQPGGNAPVPSIYKFKTTSTGSQTTPLNVTISTKANN